jgi:hypothetical protein
MSFELVETERNLAHLRPVTRPEPGAWDNFLSGTARFTMQGFAKAGRAASMAAAAPLLVFDTAASGTELSDRYFRFHDEVFGSAVEHWTPKPGEVGAAAEIAGMLLSTLPLAIASPAAAVAVTQLSAAEDLVRKGVDAGKAQAVGAVQAAGLGLGIWVPILGQTGFQRMIVGGAGFNIGQGVVSRGVSGSILEGTAAAEDYAAFDWSAVTLDALLGLAFGGMAHLSPAQRKSGERAWKRIHEWVSGAKPSDIDALAALRQAQHLNVETAPGRLTEPADIEAHVQRVRTAIEQLAKDEPVNVSDLPAPKGEADPARAAENERVLVAMQKEAAALAKAYDIVLEDPIGPVNDPMVRLTPEEIGEVIVERGPVWQKGEAEIRVGGFGLVKFIWKHGEKSGKAKGSQVTREDVLRAPEVMRNFEPIKDETAPDGKRSIDWQVKRADGKKVIYSVSKFTDGDGQHHLVSLFVNDRDDPRFSSKPLSKERNRRPESPGVASKASPRDTGAETSSSSQRGQDSGSAASVRPDAEGGQPRPDPLADEAARFVTENPDLELVVGRNADGTPIVMKAKDFLAESERLVREAGEDAKLFDVAAACMLGSS